MLKLWRRTRSPLPTTAAPDTTLVYLLGLAAFVLYATTARPVVGFEDSAGFTVSCLNGDIAHAPGYPLYSLLCYPFGQLPTESPAYAATLFSAACAAAAVMVLAAILYRLSQDAVTAIGGAALFAVSRTFWSQATIPEVYTLNVLLFLIAFLGLLQWRQAPTMPRLTAVVFISALALTNHWPLYLLAAPAFLPLLWCRRGWLRQHILQPRNPALLLAALFIGLLPYAYLYWRANHPVAFVRLPAAPSDFTSLWQIVSRDILSPAIDNPAGATWIDKAVFTAFLARQTLAKELGLLGGVLIVVGFIRQWRDAGLAAAAALSLLFAGATGGLVLLLNFLYDEVGAQTFAPYPLLPYAAACVWAALAARYLFKKWRGAALAAVCVYALVFNYSVNDRSNDTLAADLADVYLETLPAGAFFPLAPLYGLLSYRQYVTGQRPAVRLYPAPTPYTAATITPGEKLYPPNTLSFAEEMAIVNDYAATHPLCYNTYIPFSVTASSREYLLFSCLRGELEPTFTVNERATDFLRRLAAEYRESNDWQMRKIGGRLITDAVRSLMLVRARRPLPPSWGMLLEELSTTPPGQLAVMEYLVRQPDLVMSAERADLFKQAAQINLPLLNRRQRARLLSALADSYAAVSPRDDDSFAVARHYHRQAADLVPAADAPAVQAAWRFYQREKIPDELAAIKLKYGQALLSADTGKLEE